MKNLHTAFVDWVKDSRVELSYNGQTIVLERMLNTKFPNPGSLIYIENVDENFDLKFIFQNSEAEAPVYTYLLVEGMPPSYIFKYSELSGFLYDFIVWVPASLVFNENLMKAWLNRFVIAGSRYIIKIY